MTEPTEHELRGAKFLVEQIDACGDNTDKKIRLVAMIMHSINDELDDHKKLTLAIYENMPKESRGREHYTSEQVTESMEKARQRDTLRRIKRKSARMPPHYECGES